MPTDRLLADARALWEHLASAPISFPPPGGVSVAVAPHSKLCPSGWVGVVALGDAAIVTAPDEAAAVVVRRAAAQASGDAAGAIAALPARRVLGPAALAYVSAEGFRAVAPGGPVVERLPGGDEGLRALEAVSGAEDAGEASLDEITSPAFAIREHGELVAAAGYRTWPGRTAHLSVLTAPGQRGRGLARAVGSAATAHALAAGLLPQWRARPPESRRVAAALGYRELGSQLSVELVRTE